MYISQDQKETYLKDGVVKLTGAFDPKWVNHLRLATEENLRNSGPMAEEYAASENSSRFHGDQFLWTHNEKFKKFVIKSEAAKIAAELMNSNKINMFFDHLLVKEPSSTEATPWHQDGPYWKIRGDQICSIWFALDDVTEESGGVRYVKGSHIGGKCYRPQSFNGEDVYANSPLEKMPDIDTCISDDDIICYDLKPGDCLIHHANIIHGAKGNNSSNIRRRGYATRWCGDDVIWDARPGTVDVLYDPGLKDGDPLDCELFPVIWKK